MYVPAYFRVTVRLARPLRLLVTVMLCGFVATLKVPEYRPPPLFERTPSTCPLDVTETVSVAVALVLVACTVSSRLELLYSACWMATVSVRDGAGVTASTTFRVAVMTLP